MKMLSSSLKAGDIIEVKTWFGKIKCIIIRFDKKLVVATENMDIIFPLSSLSYTSRAITPHSKWWYIGKKKEIEAQYVEYTEEDGENKKDLHELFLTQP